MLRTMRAGAYGILADTEGRVLMHVSAKGSWWLPGGTVEQGEDPAETVMREFAEQTGRQVKVTGVRKVGAAVVAPIEDHSEHNTLFVYDVEAVDDEPSAEFNGHKALRWARIADLDDGAMGAITAIVLDLDTERSPDLNGVRGLDPVFDLGSDRMTEPDSRDEPKPKRVQRVGVYAWITDPEGRVLITLISEGFPAAGKWHLPGGGLDFGEQPADSLLREIVEETSQEAELLGLRNVDSRHNPNAVGIDGSPEDFQGIHIIYNAAIADPKPLQIQDIGGSTAEARWMTLEELATLPITPAVEAALSD